MLKFIKNALRRKKIRKFASHIPTGFIPLTDARKVTAVIDVEDACFDRLREEILDWGHRNNLQVCLYFIDFRKTENDGQLLTSPDTTVFRKETDWLGTPDLSKLMNLLGEQSDIFISLIDNGNFCIDFICKCAKARFKIGRYGYDGHVYDMIITGDCSGKGKTKPDSLRVFAAITDFLEKVR